MKRNNVDVRVMREPGFEDLKPPEYQSEGASGMDISAAVDGEVIIPQGGFCLVNTGLRMEIPKGYEGQIRPRSGIAASHGIGILNTPGTIDSDYRGPVRVVLFNFGREPFVIRRGDRIAQLVIARTERARLILVNDIEETPRGDGGFGHTGI